MSKTSNQSILRKAFWSRNFPYRKWSSVIRARDFIGHSETIKTSFLYLPVGWLIEEFGLNRFIKRWPEIRTLFDPKAPLEKKRLQTWDTVWAITTIGDSQYPVSHIVANLGKKRRELLREVVRHPGITTYEISLDQKRDYSRVFKDQKLLVEKGLLFTREDVRNGRKIQRLFSSDSVNTELFFGAAKQRKAAGGKRPDIRPDLAIQHFPG